MPSPHRMSPRSADASKHPGLANKTMTHQTSAEVKAAAEAKEAAKVAKKEAQHAHIKCVTEFESNARDNKDLIDATPQPNIMPRGSHADLTASEADGHNSDGHTYVPPDESNDELDDVVEATPTPKEKKKATPAPTKATKSIAARKVGLKATKQLAPIAKSSDDKDKPLSLK